MKTNEMEYFCPPETALLRAIRNDSLSWKEAIGELVDNALDVGAMRVEVSFGPRKYITVRDDGPGIANIGNLVTLGKHVKHTSTRLGRYGIGFKSAACWMWGKVRINTVHDGSQWTAVVDWQEIENEGDWKFFQTIPIPTLERNGTDLHFENVSRNYPNIEDLNDHLSFIFTPALRWLGRQIIIEFKNKRHSLSPYELPPLEHIVEDVFYINSKRVRLRAGVVKEGHQNLRQGFIYYSGHRVIEWGSLGAKDYSTSRIAGTVQLAEEWGLTKNKTGISDVDKGLLDDEVFKRCELILRFGQDQSMNLALKSLTQKVESNLMQQLLATKKEQRAEGDQRGTIKPRNTGRKRTHATNVSDLEGKVRSKAAGGIKIFWSQFHGQPDILGNAEILPELSKVTFNTLHPFIERIQRDENVDAISLAAITLFSERVVVDDGSEPRFPFMRDYSTVSAACSHLLKESVSLNTKSEAA